jgi:uncharacterized protein (DUF2147 family)
MRVIIKGLKEEDSAEYNSGKFFRSGRIRYFALEGNMKVKVHLRLWHSLFGRTQTWQRVK